MPDPLLPSGDDDEVVAAYVDGEATPEEVTWVEASAELRARAEAFAAIADRVGADPGPRTVDPDRRDQHIAAALAASRTETNVTALGPARSTHRPWYRQPVAAVAAVILAAVVAIPVLAQLGGSDDAETAGSVASVPHEAADDGGSAEESTEGAERSADAPQATLSTADLSADGAAAEAAPANGTDGAAGDVGADATSPQTTFGATAFARLLPAAGTGFVEFEAAVDAYDEIHRQNEDGQLGDEGLSVEFAVIDDACVTALDDVIILIAEIDGEDVVLGRANGVTVVLDGDTCEIIFPD